jgi:cell division transport system permease protein
MAGKSKHDAKSFADKKRRRRQWLTFVRMCRYGINNFSRNAWLTIAATAIMTITLLIIFITVSARMVLTDTVNSVRDKTDVSIYLEHGTSKDQAQPVLNDITNLSSVRAVTFETSTQARNTYIEENKDDPTIAATINQATNEFPETIHVIVQDINNTSQLQKFVDTNTTIKPLLDPNRAPTFTGAGLTTINKIGGAIDFIQKIGIVIGAIFMAISILVIFNTIRMAIFNRREEIQMMKLIGAERSFIRGPFLVEAIVYGVIAALIATGVGYAILYSSTTTLAQYVTIQPTLDFVSLYIAFVVLGMVVIGALIGVISSSLATQRYLKL